MKRLMIPIECHALARQFLTQKGYDILRDNYSRGLDDISFIALDKSERTVIFIELRLRHRVVSPNENPRMDFNKRSFERLTLSFLSNYPFLAEYDIRADQLNLVLLDDERVIINYYRNVASIVFK